MEELVPAALPDDARGAEALEVDADNLLPGGLQCRSLISIGTGSGKRNAIPGLPGKRSRRKQVPLR